MTQEAPLWTDAASIAEAVFIARDALENLSEESTAFGSSAVSFHDIYQFAMDPDAVPGPDLARALKSDNRVRNDLHHLLRRSAPLQPLTKAAASSGAITTRQGTGFEMTLRESHADRGQVYLIIRLGEFSYAVPKTLFVINEGAGCRKIPLPAPSGGVIQMLLDVTSDLATSLSDPKTDVFLR